jgi:NAD(P)-dependent dehydrogenase (short-subunit alcohol dehydrogenase family)
MPGSQASLLEGKVALITGGTGLLGNAIAGGLFNAGAKVILNYFHDGKRAESLSRIGEIYKADVNDSSQFEKMIEYVKLNYGQIDILINNYGPILYKNIINLEKEEFQRIALQNMLPVFNGCRSAGKAMIEQGFGGRIINIAAAGADEIKPKKKTVPYFIGKNAVIMLTRTFAREFAPFGITVNAVSPGIIKGAKNPEEGSISGNFKEPIGERISPDKITSLILFLCSDEAGQITGENITIAAGMQLF